MTEQMTKGEYLESLTRCAGEYYKGALASIKAKSHMNNLSEIDFWTMEGLSELSQNLAEAVIVDFINFVGRWHGLDLGLYTKHLAEEYKKQKVGNQKKEK